MNYYSTLKVLEVFIEGNIRNKTLFSYTIIYTVYSRPIVTQCICGA